MSSFAEKYGNKYGDMNGNRSSNVGVDFKQITEDRKRDVFKFPEGKTEFIILWPDELQDDPLYSLGYHKSLFDVDYYTVPCDEFNKGEQCCICAEVNAMKADDFNANKFFFNPIQLKTDTYGKIAILNDGEWGKKAYWVRFSKTVVDAFVEHYKNLEEDEVPFYDKKNPMKVIVNYDKTKPAATQYSVSFKALKKELQPTEKQKAAWLAQFEHELTYYFPSRNQEALTKILTEYIERKAAAIDAQTEEE